MNKKLDYMIKCVEDNCTLVSLGITDNEIVESVISCGTLEYCRAMEKRLRNLLGNKEDE